MKNSLFLSHTNASRKFHKAGIGEIANTAKLCRLIDCPSDRILDIHELCGDNGDESYLRLSDINRDLAELNQPILEDLQVETAKKIVQRVQQYRPEEICILSWDWAPAVLFAAGVHRLCPTLGKIYIFQETDRILTTLYEPCDLIITESLRASMKAIEAGIPAWKLAYIPHHFPENLEKIPLDPDYLKKVAQANFKPLIKTNKTIVIGCVSRIVFYKNVNYVLDAVQALRDEGHDLLFVLKGNFENETSLLHQHLNFYLNQPWFLWDREPSPYPDLLSGCRTFDIFVHLSGREGASNVVVDMLALGVPTLVLDATTNPCLFKEGAVFVKNDGNKHFLGGCLYQAPDVDDFTQKLRAFVESPSLRQEWGARGKAVAKQRFHPQMTRDRMPLIFEALRGYRKGETRLRSAVEALYESDLKCYKLL